MAVGAEDAPHRACGACTMRPTFKRLACLASLRRSDGNIVCLGLNDYGQTSVPGTGAPWKAVSANMKISCGIRADTSVVCWGLFPLSLPGTGYVSISAGVAHVCGIRWDCAARAGALGGAYACAAARDRALHLAARQLLPPRPPRPRRSDKTLACTGNNDYGQVTVPFPAAMFNSVSAGDYQTW